MKFPLLLSITTSLCFTLMPSPGQAADPAAPATTADAAADGQFLHSVAYTNNGELKFSDYAEGRSKRQEVKNFATAMVKDHKEMGKQLKAVADKVNVKLPDDLLAEQKDIHAKLKGANDADFDRMYMDTMVADHKKAVAAFGTAVKNSKHPEVKKFAEANLPHLQGHLKMAEELAKKLGSVDAK
jgi:putative membrane protein